MTTKTNLGVALVGLGEYATGQLIPALQETQYCHVAALVSGSVEKKQYWQRTLSLPDEALYDYGNFDSIVNNPGVDIVYVVLPNFLHAEFCIRAARAGKHVICEKPLAMNLAECRQIQEAVQHAGVRFSMGYRLHFDPYNLEMIRLGQKEIHGRVRQLTLLNSMDIGNDSPWRLDRQRAGGGPLVNNGIYCIQAAIYVTGKLPVAVDARFAPVTNPERFDEVEEGLEWTMFFDGGTKAFCETSYSKNQNVIHAEADEGWFRLEPAYEYEGLKGEDVRGEMLINPVNQQARQMDDFARCIMDHAETRVPIEMGIRDMEIIAAVYESARTGARVAIELEHLLNW